MSDRNCLVHGFPLTLLRAWPTPSDLHFRSVNSRWENRSRYVARIYGSYEDEDSAPHPLRVNLQRNLVSSNVAEDSL